MVHMIHVTKWKKPKKAERSITVYKILNTNCVSPYMGFVYNLGVKYNTDMESYRSQFTDGFYVEAGFHAFTDKRALLKSSLKKDFISTVAFKCIILKGSSYYISSCKKEIVSDSIIIKRRLLFNRF